MTNQNLELKYKEMVRLSEVLDNYARSSFEDFKLLSAIGVLLAFQPATSFFSIDNDSFLLVGFLAIFFIIAFIGFYGLMKQSIAVFYLGEIAKFEKEFRELLESSNTEMESFKVAENWKYTGSKKQKKVAEVFYGFFYSVLIFFPTIVLYFWSSITHAIFYCVVAMCVSFIHHYTLKLVYAY